MDKLKAAHLALRHRSNQRKIWVCVASVAGCVAALLLHLIWEPFDTAPGKLIAYFGLVVVALVAIWFLVKLARENATLRRALGGEDE